MLLYERACRFGLSLGLVSLTACAGSIFNTEAMIDTHVDKSGQTVLSDTPRNWQIFVDSVNTRIESELRGGDPPDASTSWNDYWVSRLNNIPDDLQNRQKYLRYIIEVRRQVGLPELMRP